MFLRRQCETVEFICNGSWKCRRKIHRTNSPTKEILKGKSKNKPSRYCLI